MDCKYFKYLFIWEVTDLGKIWIDRNRGVFQMEKGFEFIILSSLPSFQKVNFIKLGQWSYTTCREPFAQNNLKKNIK